MQPDFGKTARDYSRHRQGFPDELFTMFEGLNIELHGMRAVDLGTGTGTLARGMARRGATVTGVDPSPDMTAEAQRLDLEWGVSTDYINTTAEKTGLESDAFDIVTSGQSWWWFEKPAVTHEVVRILKPDGKLVICSFDWVPLPDNVVEMTEQLIEKHNPDWHMGGGDGTHPEFITDLQAGGFLDIRSDHQTLDVTYTKEAWRGRIRASAGVGASLQPSQVGAFDAELAEALDGFTDDDILSVHHALFVAVGTKASR